MQYFESILPAQLMMVSVVFYFLFVIFQGVLIYSENQKLSLVFEVLTGVLHIIFNVALIPIMGVEGASLTVVLSYASFLLLGLFIHQTREYTGIMLKKLPKPLFASTGIIFALYFFSEYFFVSIPLGLLLFLGILYIIKGLDERDREVFAELIGKDQQ